MLLFDGRRAHAVAPFQGERYSLVFFTIQQYREARPTDIESMVSCSLIWPIEKKKTLRYYAGLLGTPKGYIAGSCAQSILKYVRKTEPPSPRRWLSCLATLGGAVLKHVLTFAALTATILGCTEIALRDLLLVCVCPAHVCEEIL